MATDPTAFHNGLRLLMNIEGHELVEAGVFEADDIEGRRAFLADPPRALIRLSDKSFDRLWALMVRRGVK